MFKKLFLIVALLSGWGANSLWAWHQVLITEAPSIRTLFDRGLCDNSTNC
jgi:hypothetical protein